MQTIFSSNQGSKILPLFELAVVVSVFLTQESWLVVHFVHFVMSFSFLVFWKGAEDAGYRMAHLDSHEGIMAAKSELTSRLHLLPGPLRLVFSAANLFWFQFQTQSRRKCIIFLKKWQLTHSFYCSTGGNTNVLQIKIILTVFFFLWSTKMETNSVTLPSARSSITVAPTFIFFLHVCAYILGNTVHTLCVCLYKRHRQFTQVQYWSIHYNV